jgi:HAD superfamily hydrolase (TIGR01509 family)
MGRVALELAMDPKEFAEIAIGHGGYGAGDHAWHRLERAEIDVGEYNRATDEMARARGHRGFPPLPVDRILASQSSPRGEMMELLEQLRAHGVRTGIITNNVVALSGWRTLADWDALVDVVIDSCQVGMRKPESRIYLRACTRRHATQRRWSDRRWYAGDLGLGAFDRGDRGVANSW